ncbi:hypothetical protein ACIPF8_21405 [Collimonas sp. NPDC087041]|uniref:hypothetical protein n=1 Tax=Collimonas sp. NPDC087041 TaxID=3363960 RepID=UPI00381B1717
MNDMIPSVPKDYKPKTFWERPEGVTGQIVGVAAVAGLGFVVYKALPFIITLLQNAIYATILGVVAVALGFVVTDRRFWRLGSYMYQSAMRKITQIFVEIDPIGIMQNYVVDLEKKLANMTTRIASLRGMIRSCQDEIAKNEDIQKKSLMLLKEAKKQSNSIVIAEESRQAERMREANGTYQDLLNKMQLLYNVLIKYQEISKFLIKDISREIDVKKRKKQMSDNAYSAIQSAKSIINGDSDAKAMFDLADEYLANDYAMKIGEIEDFVRMSDTFVQTVNLQNGVYEANAMKLIEEWETRSDSILLGADAKRSMVARSYAQSDSDDVDFGGARGANQSFQPTSAPQKKWFDES